MLTSCEARWEPSYMRLNSVIPGPVGVSAAAATSPFARSVKTRIPMRDRLRYGRDVYKGTDVVLTNQFIGWRPNSNPLSFLCRFHAVPLAGVTVSVDRRGRFLRAYCLQFWRPDDAEPFLTYTPYNAAAWLATLLDLRVAVDDPWGLVYRPVHAFWFNSRHIFSFFRIALTFLVYSVLKTINENLALVAVAVLACAWFTVAWCLD